MSLSHVLACHNSTMHTVKHSTHSLARFYLCLLNRLQQEQQHAKELMAEVQQRHADELRSARESAAETVAAAESRAKREAQLDKQMAEVTLKAQVR